MSSFYVRDGVLFCESVRIEEIAERVPTPFYLYSHSAIKRACSSLKEAFNKAHLLAYAYKANSNVTLCWLIKECGFGAEVASLFELYNAKRVGLSPSSVIFNGNGKSTKEIDEAVKWGVFMINVDAAEEIPLIEKAAKKYKRKMSVSLRINPSFYVDTHPYIATAQKESKFGLHVHDFERVQNYLKECIHVTLDGLHTHIGSQIKDESPFIEALKIMLRVRREFEKKGHNIQYVNIGGGFLVDYSCSEDAPLHSLSTKIEALIEGEGVHLLLEPGRRVIARAGVLVVRVLYKKRGGKYFVVVDGGMNCLLRPALYGAFHGLLQVPGSKKIKADIVGPLCEEGDFLAKDLDMFEPQIGELLCIMDAGAYGYTMSSNYNFKPKPAEVLVKNASFYIIREAEEFEDIIRREHFICV